jgi:hypothetical protein
MADDWFGWLCASPPPPTAATEALRGSTSIELGAHQQAIHHRSTEALRNAVDAFHLAAAAAEGEVGIPQHVEFDEVVRGLRGALKQASERAVTLFRRWDTEGTGTVSKERFCAGMAVLSGRNLPRAACEALYDSLGVARTGEDIPLSEVPRDDRIALLTPLMRVRCAVHSCACSSFVRIGMCPTWALRETPPQRAM